MEIIMYSMFVVMLLYVIFTNRWLAEDKATINDLEHQLDLKNYYHSRMTKYYEMMMEFYKDELKNNNKIKK